MKQQDRTGVNAVESIVINQLKWVFREQTTVDWGIDAHIEIADAEQPLGRLIAAQIKSGPSFFRMRGENYVYYGEGRHLWYWTTHSLPVVIILHNPATGLTVWQRVTRDKIKFHKEGRWSIEIPPAQVLSAASADELQKGIGDESAFRRIWLVLHASLIRAIGEKKKALLRADEWVNKSLGFRGARIYYDSFAQAEPDFVLNRMLPTHEFAEYLGLYLPFLNYKYLNTPDQSGYEEFTMHDVEVWLNDVGKAFLTLEDYYEKGLDISNAPPTPIDETMYAGDDDEVDYDEFMEEFEEDDEADEDDDKNSVI